MLKCVLIVMSWKIQFYLVHSDYTQKHTLQTLKNETQWSRKKDAITNELLNKALMLGQQSLITEQLYLRNLIKNGKEKRQNNSEVTAVACLFRFK